MIMKGKTHILKTIQNQFST